MTITRLKTIFVLFAIALLTSKCDEPEPGTGMKVYSRGRGAKGLSVQQTNDGGYIIVGETYLGSGKFDDVWLIKTNAYGDSVWSRTYGGEQEDFGNSVKQTSDGGYVIAGYTKSY
ncbi:MAG: hypothetical protein JSW54_04435, partial [Fidelibacterota bacterium]